MSDCPQFWCTTDFSSVKAECLSFSSHASHHVCIAFFPHLLNIKACDLSIPDLSLKEEKVDSSLSSEFFYYFLCRNEKYVKQKKKESQQITFAGFEKKKKKKKRAWNLKNVCQWMLKNVVTEAVQGFAVSANFNILVGGSVEKFPISRQCSLCNSLTNFKCML